MIRWLVVLGTLGLALFAVWGVRGYQPEQHIFDEISAYEVSPERPLRVNIPGGIDEAILVSWAVVAPLADFDPRAAYRYGLEVKLQSPSSVEKKSVALTSQSRVSHDPRKPLALGDYTARLAESPDWLADARTERVDLAALGRGGGVAEIRVRPGEGNRRVMVRLTYLEPLGELERDLRERSLRVEKGRRMVEGRSSLGFADLPDAVRERALGKFERRFPALGRDGTDYVSRTLWIGNRIPSPLLAEPALKTWTIGPARYVAFNFDRAVKLRVLAEPRVVLTLRSGVDPPYTATVGESGQLDLTLEAPGPRSVSIGAETPVSARFSLATADATAQIGTLERPIDEERVFVGPDVRVQRYAALDPKDPVVVRLARGQKELGLTFRGFVPWGRAAGRVRAVVRGATGPAFEREPFEEELDASTLDWVGERRVTTSRHSVVVVPAGTESVAITGDPGTMVLPWVHEPGVLVDRFEDEYEVELDAGMVWRNAPCLRCTAAAIRAENDRELEKKGRIVRLETIVRIEPLRSSGPSLVERVSRPVGTPLSRIVWTPSEYRRGAPAEDLWTMLPSDLAVSLQVPAVSNQNDALAVVYRVPSEALGKELSLEVDGRLEKKQLIALRSGRFEVSTAAGPHEVVLRGAPGSVAFASAPPSAGGRAFRRQVVYELGPGGTRDFSFERGADELVALFVSAVRESGEGPIELEFEIDPGKRLLEQRRLVRRVTVGQGVVQANASEKVLLSELEDDADGPLPHALGHLRIVVGDDLAPGEHVLRLRSLAPNNGVLWARAVVAGRKLARGANTAGDE